MNHTQNDNDQKLLTLLNEGDRDAFETIYRTYAKELYRYARKNISVKEDCEEIIQDTFESLWIRRKNISLISLRAYLFQIVRFKVIRYFQHNKVKRKYAEHYKIFEIIFDNSDETDRNASQLGEMIQQSILLLPKRCQEAIKLRLHEDLSNVDIAKRMNITKQTLEVYMSKAMAQLRAAYPNPS